MLYDIPIIINIFVFFHIISGGFTSIRGKEEGVALWIKLHKKLLNWEWYSDINVTRLFIHLLLIANWQDGRFKGVEIPRGSLITGRKKLAKETGLSEQQIRTAIDKLKSTNEITTITTNTFTIISIQNYDIYQENPWQTRRSASS